MQETQTSSLRRSRDSIYQTYLSGSGIDVGAGDDGLGLYESFFLAITGVRHWDVADGDAKEMASVADNQYDFVHSSHCLE